MLMVLPGAGQQRQIYLFPDFRQGAIFVGGAHRPRNVTMNIDALGQRIYYYEGQTLMELTQLHRLDSIKISGHTFVLNGKLLCERLALQRETVLVNWKFNKVNMGAAGRWASRHRTMWKCYGAIPIWNPFKEKDTIALPEPSLRKFGRAGVTTLTFSA